MDILIGGKSFKAISVVDLTKDADVPEHKVEEQFSISDHIILKPAEFELELQLFRDEGEVEALLSLYDAKQPTSLTTEFGHYDNMVIKSVRIKESDSQNIAYATVHVKQILKAEARTAAVNLPNVITQDESKYPGGNSAVSPLDGWMARHFSNYQEENPPQDEPQSWADYIAGFISWLTGGG